MYPVSRRALQLRAEAVAILEQATTATPLAAWAVGVYQFCHTLHLSNLDRLDPWHLPVDAGGSLGDRSYSAHRGGFAVYDNDRWASRADHQGARLVVTWTHVWEVLARKAIGDQLLTEITDSLAERTRLTPNYSPNAPRTAEDREAWSQIENRCTDVAARVWQACRPIAEPVQLDLFAELAVAS